MTGVDEGLLESMSQRPPPGGGDAAAPVTVRRTRCMSRRSCQSEWDKSNRCLETASGSWAPADQRGRRVEALPDFNLTNGCPMSAARRSSHSVEVPRSSYLPQRRIYDGQRVLARHIAHLGHADHAPRVGLGDLHGAGRRRAAGRWLREGRGHRGVEPDVALHLLEHLVEVAVERGY